MSDVSGYVAPGFERVREEFARGFVEGDEVGAAVAAYVGGRAVVDLWGGEARPGVPWQEDTLGSVFSTTKGPTALTVQMLADRGQLDLEAQVAEYWPSFAAAGKEQVTVRQVLNHTSGVITFPYLDLLHDPAAWGAVDTINARIAAAAPMWTPGEMHGYHALTFGWILGEVVTAVTGRSLGTVWWEEVAAPLGLDFWIGLPAAEHGRVADLIDAEPPTHPALVTYLAAFNPETWTGQAHLVGDGGVLAVAEVFNLPVVRSAEIPAGGGIGTARSLARMYGALADGGRLDGVSLVSPASIAAHTTEQVRGPDAVLLVETRFALGYALPTELSPLGPHDEAFGHGGLGGSLGFADPSTGVGFAYVPNQLRFVAPGESSPAQTLAAALYASV